MRKILVCIFAILLYNTALPAQNYRIEKSEEFDEPDAGWNKLLQLKNGNTLFFHANSKKGIEITVYDKSRKKVAEQTIASDKWDADDVKIFGLYEINGEAVVFLQTSGDNAPLFRLRISGQNGALVKEDDLGTPNNGTGKVIVEKDPGSDCYAVIFDSYGGRPGSAIKEEIKVVHFDGAHKKINEASFRSPTGYQSMNFSTVAVDGNKAVYVLIRGKRTTEYKDHNWKLFFYKLGAGETAFKSNIISSDLTFNELTSIMVYNHNNDVLQLYTSSLSSSESKMGGRTTNYYLPIMTYIDPDSLKLLARKGVAAAKVSQYAHDHVDKDYDYSGLPRQMIINKDNTTTLLMEEMKTVDRQTFLEYAGIDEFSERGEELRGYTVGKKQDVQAGTNADYMTDRNKGVFVREDDAFKFLSYDYINTGKGHYVVFNDVPENYGKDEDASHLKTMLRVSGADAFCVKLNDNGIEKSYLFGEPERFSSAFCMMSTSSLDKDTNTYAVIVLERDGRKKQARIAWVTFD